MAKVLGLDPGITGIGCSLVDINETEKDESSILTSLSRIIPTDTTTINEFRSGNTVSTTKQRTLYRSARRLQERYLLRRQRLFRLLKIIGFLPEHFSRMINEYGHFIDQAEPKIAWCSNEFIFKDSFEEMLKDFKDHNPKLFERGDKKVAYDWTLYYLRKKALSEKISKEELSWVILNFNQKRGYGSGRINDEDIEQPKTRKEFYVGKVVKVEDTGEIDKKKKVFIVELENGSKGTISRNKIPEWVGKEKKIIVTVHLDKDGADKLNEDGTISQKFRIPTDEEWENEWEIIKDKTEKDVKNSGKTVGCYIYDALLNNPSQKIKGELVRVIDRDFYKDELKAILEKQSEFHKELSNVNLYAKAIEDLYRSNENYRSSIKDRDIIYLIVDDIIFYQRPLKINKHLISDCKFEYYKDKDGKKYRLKAIPKSHPLFQEFRLWKFISDLRILKDGKNITNDILKCEDDYVKLFKWMNSLKEIDNIRFIRYKGFNIPKSEHEIHKWNFDVENEKKYPCNETRSVINSRLKKKGLKPIDDEHLINLWHILYSVTVDKEIKKALAKFAENHEYESGKFVEALKGCVFKREYGAYSHKAINKLLSLMRRGKCWEEEYIDKKTLKRIEHIISGEEDSSIGERTRECFKELTKDSKVSDFKGLEEWRASYLIYDRHSEGDNLQKWSKPEDIDTFLKSFKQHSLRNPIVESVVVETLKVVRDIWKEYGKIDEIHIELAREMKQTTEQRKRENDRIIGNEKENYKIRKALEELHKNYKLENLCTYKPSHQERFKLYSEFAFSQSYKDDDMKTVEENEKMKADESEAKKIHNKFSDSNAEKQPTKDDIEKYKLWLDGKYISPYTGKPIPLSRLFTDDYEIDHIIPRALYYDNSLSNKVICEAKVNSVKGARLGLQFIKEDRVVTDEGNEIRLLSEEQYLAKIDECYSRNKRKANNLKLTEVPSSFTNSQLNNTRYISRFISEKLSNIVREDGERESVSKNVIITSGGVTDALKRDWGLQDVWNKKIGYRFDRLNIITKSNDFGNWVCEDGKRFFRISMPIDLSKGFNKKRIDHRHHALDAIVIACTNRSHIKYFNNLSSRGNEDDTHSRRRSKVCYKHKLEDTGGYQWRVVKPWNNFTKDVSVSLDNIVVSFKNNVRVINKGTNYFTKFENGEKKSVKQITDNHWVVRQPLHEDNPYGCRGYMLKIVDNVEKRELIKDEFIRSKVEERFFEEGSMDATKESINENPILGVDGNRVIKTVFLSKEYIKRQPIAGLAKANSGFKSREKVIKVINKVVDSTLKDVLLKHLENNDGIEKAFSAEGIERFNSERKIPVRKLLIEESGESRFPLGKKRSNSHKWMQVATGTNLFFAIYQNDKGERSFETIPLRGAIENLKKGLQPAPLFNKENLPLKFVLSPNDLVYVPKPEQIGVQLGREDIDKKRIYKMVSCTKDVCNFVPANIAYRIMKTVELGSNDKSQRAWSSLDGEDMDKNKKQGKGPRGEMIKDICVPIKVNRIGKIIEIDQIKIE